MTENDRSNAPRDEHLLQTIRRAVPEGPNWPAATHPTTDDLTAYVGGESEHARQEFVRTHLAACAECTELAEWLKSAESTELALHAGEEPATNLDTLAAERLHECLLEQLHREVARNERQALPVQPPGDALVGHGLIQLTGRLAGSASAELRARCRAVLWPRVRATADRGAASPPPVVSLRPLLDAAVALLHVESLDLAARQTIVPFPKAAAVSGRSEVTSSAPTPYALLHARLQAAWLIEGLQELWPASAETPQGRQIVAELRDVDDYLRDRADHLIPSVVELAAIGDFSVWANRESSGVLQGLSAIPTLPGVHDNLTAGDTGLAAIVVLRASLFDELGDEVDEMSITRRREGEDSIIEVEAATGGLVGIWFSPASETALTLDYRGAAAYDAVVRARLGDGGPVTFLGVARRTAMRLRHDRLTIPIDGFSGDHGDVVAALRRILTIAPVRPSRE